MPEQQKRPNTNKVVSQQSAQGKKLTQVGRDYIRYLQLSVNSGNWITVLMNVAILAFIGHGVTNSVYSFVSLVTEMRAENTLCSAAVNKQMIELAEAVARTNGFLSETDKQAIYAVSSAQKVLSTQAEQASPEQPLSGQALPGQLEEPETVKVQIQILKDGTESSGKRILSQISELLDLLIDEIEFSIDERNKSKHGADKSPTTK